VNDPFSTIIVLEAKIAELMTSKAKLQRDLLSKKTLLERCLISLESSREYHVVNLCNKIKENLNDL